MLSVDLNIYVNVKRNKGNQETDFLDKNYHARPAIL